ncbi:U3 small nucleolar ribonucleoprotein protein MPP10-like [Littorina saxatilis]|uniref:U3 small nucleolar ribonucleoprotein protein MPP10 n=1 Tax=Littorina saxatilis TaxID=31220 RepID=A0AAN9C2C4_9CAEN
MADLAELLVAKTAKEYELLTRNPGDRLRVKADPRSAARLLKLTKNIHDSSHSFDEGYRSEFIPELIVDGFDDEQIYQEQELQNDAANRKLLEAFATTSIEDTHFFFLSATKRRGKQALEQKRTQINKKDNDIADESIELDANGNSEVGADNSDESDDELAEIKKRIKSRDSDGLGLFNGQSLDDSEDDDTLFKGEKDDDEDDPEEEEEDDENDFDFDLPDKGKKSTKEKKEKGKTPVRRKTEVDDKFFKLAEMEEFLEQEDRREEQRQKQEGKTEEGKDGGSSEESEGESEDIDMYGDWSDDDQGEEVMYGDFFDPPADGEEMPETDSKKTEPKSEEEEEEDDDGEEDDDDDNQQDESMESDEEADEGKKKKVHFTEDTKDTSDNKEQGHSLSNFEQRNERLLRQIQGLEEESLQPRPWQMSGEVSAKARPENSLLEEHVEFEQTAPAASEITEEVTQSIEGLIMQRIKDKAFDDNQRQVRPREEAFELKTQKTLDQEKSKLSLHEVYEQEYLKLQAPDEDETNPQHEEIKKMMAFLFPRLDALASWHYKPTQAVPEVKIRNNLPAIQMEEATPITMVNSSVLAPEEVKAKKRGEVKGKTERTKEDKRRDRKQKKSVKREKSKAKEKRMKEVEKMNPGLGNKYSKERALKDLEKQSKGNIEVIKEKKSKKSMSSKTFFTKLQEEVTTQISSKTKTKKEKEKKKQLSSDKLLL